MNKLTRTSARIRQEFIDFFCQRHGHHFVPSAPVVPHDDPTLLFTNAGMNQFKPYFLGVQKPRWPRVANTQKCIRAGGKHNDLDDVGHDTYHHTFFEMLGNWSFGDYFKREAIAWAWELLTEVWGLDKARLHATYFQGDAAEGLEPDLEARDLWASATDVDPTHIHAGGKKDNFWEMGETGPCGPCSEIHIDLTDDKSGGRLVNAGDARVIEIWNLVFIQFNRAPDGKLAPLPARHVDTGMGFERVTALLQGKRSNYDTDVFTPIFAAIREVTGAPAYGGRLETRKQGDQAAVMRDVAYRVIADHARCLTSALSDGAVPDREGRGYVLRRILRRAVRYGWQYLDVHEPFIYRLVPAVVETMGTAFPELRANPQRVMDLVQEEEDSFGRTLERGIELFEKAAALARDEHHGEIRGDDAFKLHDTYGFPIDLTEIMAAERGLRVDIGEYERLMDEARERARAAGKMAETRFGHVPAEVIEEAGATDDSPKYETDRLVATVLAAVRFEQDGSAVVLEQGQSLGPGARAAIITDRTCFYAEQGGQIGDVGRIESPEIRFDVEDTARVGDAVLHLGTLVQGHLSPGQTIGLMVNERRTLTKKNHTATHVLNWALREVLGGHVQQKGSLVDQDKTRFDFSQPRPMTADELASVERLVNERIAARLPVYDKCVPQQQALKIQGLRAVFGEKYPDEVRVLSVGTPVDELLRDPQNPQWRDVSIEFCGGTHVKNTAEIEHFVLVSEEGVAKGIRRIVGMTGPTARLIDEMGAALVRRAEELKAERPEDLPERLSELQHSVSQATLPLKHRLRLRDLMGELQELVKQQQKAAAADAASVVESRIAELLRNVTRIGQATLVVAEMPEVPIEQLKTGADLVKQKTRSAAVLLGMRSGGKATLLAAMSSDLIKKGLKAGDLVKAIAPIVEGGGGGPPTMAQAGGKNPAKLAEALEAGRKWVESKLAGVK
jgi:alanyl-tRNA synthetase